MKLSNRAIALGLTAALTVGSMGSASFAETAAAVAALSTSGTTTAASNATNSSGTATVTAAASSTTTSETVAVTNSSFNDDVTKDAVKVVLSDDGVTVDGASAGTAAGTKVYLSHDIKYYEDRDTYDSGNTYGEGTDSDKHSAAEAESHTVVNITEPGTYMISGSLSQGQIAVDLGSDAKTDPDAVVTLILNGVDITCTVAPAVIFYNVYECNQEWVAADDAGTTDSYQASADVDTSDAGANVVIADGSVNNVNGSYVAKVYKDNADSKKKYKYDGAFYSKMSLNIDGGSKGDGVLNINAENEGLDSEMHLTINGGIVNIKSQDDGINTNEDGVSVTTINGGELHIVAGLGSEGDGIDSNGYLVINGGIVIVAAKPQSDSGLDSDCGSYINGGYVVATGSTMDWAESDSKQVTMNLQFAAAQGADEAIIITDTDGNVIFAYDPDKDETAGANNRGYQGAVISCPQLEVGQTYNVYVGGDVSGTEVNGLYDASTVTGFTGAALQSYTGTDVSQGGPGGMRGPGNFDGTGGPMNGNITRNEDGSITLPDGTTITKEELDQHMKDRTQNGGSQNNGTQNGGSQNGSSAASGMPAGEPPEGAPDGTAPVGEPPTDGNSGNGSTAGGTVSAASVKFYMNDRVNAFSGVADYDEASSNGNNLSNNGNQNGSTETVADFADVLKSKWYASDVEYVVNKGIFNGTSSSTFEPDADMSRAMIWTVLARIDDEDTQAAAGETWYAKGLKWAVNKIVSGGQAVSDGSNPTSSITREQLVTMLWRYAGCPVADDTSDDITVVAEAESDNQTVVTADASDDSTATTATEATATETTEASLASNLDKYTDASSVSDYAKSAMEWAVEKGIIAGTDTGALNPKASASRAQVAAIIQRYIKTIEADTAA